MAHPRARDPDGGAPVMVGSWGEGRASVRGGRGDAIAVRNRGHVVVEDLVLVGDGPLVNDGRGVHVRNDLVPPRRLAGVVVRRVEASGFRWAGIYVGGVPTDLPGVRNDAGARLGFERVTVEGCATHGNGYYGIHVSGPWVESSTDYANADVTVRGNRSWDNGGDPAYFENHSGSGIMVDDTDGAVVEGNAAWNNGFLSPSRTGGPCGIWTHASRRVVIRDNESWGNRSAGVADGCGFDLDGGVSESVVERNYSHDNDGAGFLVWSWNGAPHRLRGNVLRDNVSVDDARKHDYGAIHVGADGKAVQDVDIYHNTVIVGETKAKNARAIWIGMNPSERVRVANNVFLVAKGVKHVELGPGLVGVSFAGNVYGSTDGGFRVEDAKRSFASLAQWREAAGQERLDARDTGLFADPLVVPPPGRLPDPPRGPERWRGHFAEASPVRGAAVRLRRLGIVAPNSSPDAGAAGADDRR